MKRDWDNSFFNYIKIKWSTEVSHNFLKGKLTYIYSSLYRLIDTWCQDTTLKKTFPIEKLDLTWNKQTNFNKLCPLSPPKNVENFRTLFG